MDANELYRQATFGKDHPGKASGGQRSAGQILQQLEGIDWRDALYYFELDEIVELMKIVAKKSSEDEND